ncbi:MAG: protein kinase [Polyangiaceae bacterium]|nr:protein kinase [Polyangiaceae bacterium]
MRPTPPDNDGPQSQRASSAERSEPQGNPSDIPPSGEVSSRAADSQVRASNSPDTRETAERPSEEPSGAMPTSSQRGRDTSLTGQLTAFRRGATGEVRIASRVGRFWGEPGKAGEPKPPNPFRPPAKHAHLPESIADLSSSIDGDDGGGDTITRQWEPNPFRSEANDPPERAADERPESLVTLEPTALQTGFGERYVMRDLLGRGGMGEVRLCKDRHIGREVAIKVIRTDHMTRPDVVRRFEREARVQGQLEHPAIVPVYDFGVAPDGSMYFTMKRLRGVTFHDVLWMLRNGDPQAVATYTRRKLLSAFARACLAIAFAHSRGVLHRDLKPSNIMLGDFGEVYVLDWGLAKIRREIHVPLESRIETPSSSEHRTIVGEVVGTPGYMAPEQALGEVDRLDPRTDVYALGAILFEILTLQALHKEDSAEDVLLSTLYGADPRPSVRAPERNVPIELEAIIVRATALKQEDRFVSARDLCAAVERFLDGDHNLEQKKQMAAEHSAQARTAAAEARKGGKGAQAARERAMREVGAALALDPSERDAVATLVRLMLEVPDVMPPEARREFLLSQRAADKEKRRAMLLGYLAWLALAPPAVALGVRDWELAAVMLGFQLLAAATAWANYRGLLHERFRFLAFIAGSVSMGFLSFHMGWAVLVPGMAATHVLGYLLYGQREHWRRAISVGALSILLPFALQATHLLPPSYAFQEGSMVMLPRVTGFPPAGTLAYLVIASVAVVVAPALIASRVRMSLQKAEERLFMQSWMLKHLVPDQARNAANVMPGPPSTSA